MEDRNLVELATRLAAAGVQLTANYEPIGCPFGLKPSDIPLFLSDRDAFFARECAVEPELYREWRAFAAAGCRCTAKRSDGGACRNGVRGAATLSPQEYARRKAAGDLTCARHAKVP